jgi:hypothetical protein
MVHSLDWLRLGCLFFEQSRNGPFSSSIAFSKVMSIFRATLIKAWFSGSIVQIKRGYCNCSKP